MLYSVLADTYRRLESTAKRLEMIELLRELFAKAPPDVIDEVAYLTKGDLHPDWMGFPELEMGEKMASWALADAVGISQEEALEHVKRAGGIGPATQRLLQGGKRMAKRLTVREVYETLEAIARDSGEGSQERKVERLARLIRRATPLEARYIMRFIIGKLRLGVGDMTILDGLAEAFLGSKEKRPVLERAYNLTCDIGYVAEKVAKEGLKGIEGVGITVGRPVRMMLAQKLSTAEEIVDKMEGRCSAEFKLDGERMQIHKKGGEITVFSRRLENITHMYPDVEEATRHSVRAEEAIIEGEAVAVHPDTGELRPFQVLMRRRRKYKIKEMMEKIPVRVHLFDCLYSDGEDLTRTPYPTRRERLIDIVEPDQVFEITPARTSSNPQEIEESFYRSISEGCEGVIVKSTGADSIYQAGARSWRWIKLKRSYQARLAEPVDLVIVGAFMGRGRRAGTYGAILAAAYDKERDRFLTLCKVGSGWTDQDLEELPRRLEPHRIGERHPQVEALLEADVWFEPRVVIEVNADEITLSPVHPCGMGRIREDSGMALRFPRFTGRWRPDKSPQDATAVDQVIQMHKSQQSQ
ncbi:MAG: ATP-dependent DNA ligase [Candidatus Bathyarchaeia archaeon]